MPFLEIIFAFFAIMYGIISIKRYYDNHKDSEWAKNSVRDYDGMKKDLGVKNPEKFVLVFGLFCIFLGIIIFVGIITG